MRELNATLKQNYLLAISGGIDSMFLCDMFLNSEYKFSIAHVNFGLRNDESDEDAKFIQDFCHQNKIRFFIKKTNKKGLQEHKNSSIQMAARQFRYEWFRRLQTQYHFDWIVTAHHLDDKIETFLINLSRGSGLNGLTSIPENENSILRPLSDFSKNEIFQYANEKKLAWREDSSNQTDSYLRNRIRHHILPELKSTHPNFHKNFKQTIRRLNDNKILIDSFIENTFIKLFQKKEEQWEVHAQDLKKLEPLSPYLYHLFKRFGFKKAQEILKFLDATSGSEIQSDQYRIVKNRTVLIIQPKKEGEEKKEFAIHSVGKIEEPIAMEILQSRTENKDVNLSLDANLVEFPLKVRKKEEGDVFYPTGMKGKKKLSKYYKDEKFSKLKKENTWLLCNQNNDVIWVIGKRADRRFTSNQNTKTYLNIQLCD